MFKIVVTGADGFIGSHLIPKLRLAGNEVVEITLECGDISAASTWDKIPNADILIHLAARAFVPDSWEKPEKYLDTNVMGTVAALEYCRKNSVRMILLSSYLYGNAETLPIPESANIEASNPYALSKKLSEEVCEFYTKYFNVEIIILRLFNVYGPGQPDHFLIQSVVKQVLKNESITVRDLNPKRDYVYILDVVGAIIKSTDFRGSFEVFNIGSGKSYSIAEIIDKIQALALTELKVHNLEERRKGEILNTVADISKAYRLLHWSPQWDMDRGLAQIIFEIKS